MNQTRKTNLLIGALVGVIIIFIIRDSSIELIAPIKVPKTPTVHVSPYSEDLQVHNWFSIVKDENGNIGFGFGERYEPFVVDMRELSQALDEYDVSVYNNVSTGVQTN